ncbi:MAG: tetratricopeptide repeat-containing sensor histidine kinase [Lutibacter sp.]|uniref:tetratricopeptide repeat protein n=1 Tax=Lutibacter sp. TaxID=1925666 RepID=UPI001812303F|nr:tetratricopeptide repeat protein [Lutibacter sp.]MBT8318189.1 tetratricopeptide repeat-containing sensor histidine kinase [Lutibacter sp.]NNJ59049.1 tetratricopeptide repeat-containing sensor histidine kinase [Lutibacter sp.]
MLERLFKKSSLKYMLFFIAIVSLKNVHSQTLKDSLLIKLRTTQQDSLKVNLLLDIGEEYYYTYQDSSKYYYLKALDLARKIKNKKLEAESLLSVGYYYDTQEIVKEAIAYYSKAIDLFKSINDEQGLARCYNYIGYSFSYLNSLDKSIEFYYKSLDIFKKLNDSIGLAAVYRSFGNLYYDQQNYTKSKEYFLKSYEIHEKQNNKTGLLDTYINLGNAYSDDGNIEKGLFYYLESVKLSNNIKDYQALAINYNNIADCYLVKEDYKTAQKYFNKSLDLVNKYNFKTLRSLLFANLSYTYLQVEDYHKAIAFANKSLEYNKITDWINMNYNNHLYLSEAYEKLGDYKKALENHKIFQKYSDSIFDVKNYEQVAKSETLYELKNQEAKIDDLLKKDDLRKSELRNQKIVNYVLVFFILGFLLFIFILNSLRRAKNKANILLEIEKEKAQESDRLKSSFLANMSHEIRTPMSAILGFSSLLKDNDLNEEKRDHFIEIISKSGERLMAIINDIIDISKIESNQIKVDLENVNVSKALNDIIEIQKETNDLLAKNKIELKLKLPTNSRTIFIKTDENRFTQIFNNLISNASKFTENGSIEIGFELKNNSENQCVQFYVKDTGCGVPQSKFEDIFNRFSQAGDKDFKTGNGLGLSICKGLLNNLGGTIWLESEVGEGTTFYFTLPY